MNARQLAQRCLVEWHREDHYAEDIFSRLQSEWGFSGPDRGFARELFYGVIRHLSALDFVIGRVVSRPPTLEARLILQLGIYQLLFLRTASHAAVSETVDLAPRPQRGFINGVLRRITREISEIEEELDAAPETVRFSHPEFLLENWAAQYGSAAARQIAEWNNTPPEVFLRRNTLHATTTLDHLEPTSHPLVFRSTGELPAQLSTGEFYVQDPGTLAAVELLAPRPGEAVLDACAAPGGKTSYLAALMENQGQITATDCDPRRIERLYSNLSRLGVTNTAVEQYDWENESPERATPIYDAILADVPCSNTGVMRRRIDVRWRLQPGTFLDCAARQLQILKNLLPHVRSGGRLVYSTCSLEKAENEDIVEAFLQKNASVEVEKMVRRLPQEDGCDGAFAALFRRRS